MNTSVAIDPETGAYVLTLPASLCKEAGVSIDRPLIVEPVGAGLLLRTAHRKSLEQKLEEFDPATHGGEVMPEVRIGQECLPASQVG